MLLVCDSSDEGEHESPLRFLIWWFPVSNPRGRSLYTSLWEKSLPPRVSKKFWFKSFGTMESCKEIVKSYILQKKSGQ